MGLVRVFGDGLRGGEGGGKCVCGWRRRSDRANNLASGAGDSGLELESGNRKRKSLIIMRTYFSLLPKQRR